MSTPLLATKLYIPPVRPDLVPRPRLIERLNAGLHLKLTLVSAPAGYGKTTLLSSWLAGLGQPAVWLSLDEGDNDLFVFLHYLIAALQQLDEMIGQGARNLLQSPQLPSGEGLAIQLLNDLSAFPAPITLVLDDYQTIRRSEIHDVLGLLIDNQPPQMLTVIATRRDPRLPLARWRARGESTEIRTPDLRFTVEEARDFLNQKMGLHLTTELVRALAARTEGWIAGLQLAAISLRGSRDPADFVRQFGGSDRYVIDYLVDEVLQRQPAHVRRFLQQTAMLNELSASLCDYVRFGEAEPHAGRKDSAAILQEVERANLFLIPLDNRREWYRYHHLFAEMLAAGADDGETQASCRRAASWYEARGQLSRAIHHALTGGDLETAVRLIKIAAPEQLQHGGFVRVLSWLEALPDEVVRSDAELATDKGYILLWRGEIEAARSYADAAEASLLEEALAATRGRWLTLRAHLCPDRGPKLIQYATQAIELLDESNPFFHGAALLMLATGHKNSGNLAEMMEIFRRLTLIEERRNPFIAATAIAEMADVLRLQGKRRDALVLCQRALEQYIDRRGQPLPSLTVVLLEAAMLAYEANELTIALQRAEQCSIMAQQTGMSFIATQCRCYVDAPCRWALGERETAWAALHQARELISDDHPLYLEARQDIGSREAWLNLKQGNIPAAAHWAAAFDFPSRTLRYGDSRIYLTYVRVLLAEDRHQETAEALQWLETWAHAAGWERILLSITILRAIAAHKSGDEASALDFLAQALHLAAEEDYRRAFLDEDPVIFELLPRMRTHQAGTVAPAFVDALLNDYADETAKTGDKGAAPGALSSAVQPSAVFESLTRRELEVLQLLARGLSTPNIAERLFISAGTAKWHTINIYRKLDVHNRVQAVTRARELGLI